MNLFGSLEPPRNSAKYALSGGKAREVTAANKAQGIDISALHQLIK